MAKVSIYLNFMGNTKEAFDFYRSVSNTDFSTPIMYLKDAPPHPDMPQLPLRPIEAPAFELRNSSYKLTFSLCELSIASALFAWKN